MAAYYAKFFLISFIFGVAAGSLYVGADGYITPMLITGWFIAACISIVSFRVAAMIFCIVVGLVFGVWRIERTFVVNEYEALYGTAIDTHGVIALDPPQVERNQQVTIKLDGHVQNIRAFLYQPIDASHGDTVWIRGVLEAPENFKDFDYVGYLQRYNVYATLKKPRIIVLKPASGVSIQRSLTGLRHGLLVRSKNMFSKESGALIVGMLIGQKGAFSDLVEQAFRAAGMTHVVAVSGYNMTIVAASGLFSAVYIGRSNAGFVTILAVVIFAGVAGGSASVIRSAIMALLLVVAQLTGRMHTSAYALIWAAALMALHNPRIVMWDIGFQLSVVATLGVLYAYRLKRRDAEPIMLGEIVRPTLGAVIATAPLIAYHFQTLSVISLASNITLLPLVPWIMLFGALALVPGIGIAFAQTASALAGLMIIVVQKFAAVPFSNIPVHISGSVVILFYVGLANTLFYILYRRRTKQKNIR